MLDFAWIARRFVTLGFVEEPWRRARQATGIPSVGNFESEVYRPEDFRQMVPQPAFREMTDRDGYWGAKIVASFSDAQIAAAVEAAHYEDPRARDYLVRNLIVRRDKIARHWFGRVAPLDFFAVEGGVLRLREDMGSYSFFNVGPAITASRAFEVPVTPGVTLHDILTVFLNGNGGIDHVVNDTGAAVNATNQVTNVVSYP